MVWTGSNNCISNDCPMVRMELRNYEYPYSHILPLIWGAKKHQEATSCVRRICDAAWQFRHRSIRTAPGWPWCDAQVQREDWKDSPKVWREDLGPALPGGCQMPLGSLRVHQTTDRHRARDAQERAGRAPGQDWKGWLECSSLWCTWIYNVINQNTI